MRWIAGLVALLLLGTGGAYFAASRTAPPQLAITKPDRFVGQAGTLELTATAPAARFTSLTIALEQNGRTIPLYSLNAAGPPTATVTHLDPDRIHITRPIGKQAVPELRAGPARIVATATRSSFLNLRQVTSAASKDVEVRLEPPRIAVVSTHHYVNHGGSEMVVYRATPADLRSGVRVGDLEYPGFGAAGAGVQGGDPSLKVAFFALRHDQDPATRIVAFARDEAGAEATVTFVDNVFEKPFKKSRIMLDDAFINRVVPEILAHTTEVKVSSADMLPAFLTLNGELRQINAREIAGFAAKTSPQRLWEGPFLQLGNSQVEASFADHRTYFYMGREVDRQVHLGFDLAVTAKVPIVATNRGTVLNAGWLGIFGNCVIIDHGLGVQSLYGHLSSFDVKVGDEVAKGQTIGRSGMTGLAGGDHLHFTLLVGGVMVNPVEWWDPHWMADRVDRKLNEAR